MRLQRSDGQDTRQRLLKAAAQIFAGKGYWKATLAEICKEAEANVAAANYHFGGKEALYVESWRFSFENSLKKYPPNGGNSLGCAGGGTASCPDILHHASDHRS